MSFVKTSTVTLMLYLTAQINFDSYFRYFLGILVKFDIADLQII